MLVVIGGKIMEYIETNKFEITDIPGMNTLAFLVEKDNSASIPFYSLQKLESTNVQNDGKISKEFSVIDDGASQDIVLLTLTNKKAILSSGVLNSDGFTPSKVSEAINYGSIFNMDGIEYKEFSYTPNMKRRFTIVDTATCEEVMPSLYVDAETKQVKGRCKILPLRTYVVLEINSMMARMLGMSPDIEGKKLDYTEGVEIPVEGLEQQKDDFEHDGPIV